MLEKISKKNRVAEQQKKNVTCKGTEIKNHLSEAYFELVKKLWNKNFFFSPFFRYSLSCPKKIFLYTSCEDRLKKNS